MSLFPASETPSSENSEDNTPSSSPKKSKPTQPQLVNPVQYRAVRFISFMLEDTKHDITPTDFIKDAIARHIALYQAKRGIEFPSKMLAELTKLDLIPNKSGSEE